MGLFSLFISALYLIFHFHHVSSFFLTQLKSALSSKSLREDILAKKSLYLKRPQMFCLLFNFHHFLFFFLLKIHLFHPFDIKGSAVHHRAFSLEMNWHFWQIYQRWQKRRNPSKLVEEKNNGKNLNGFSLRFFTLTFLSLFKIC